MFAYACKCPPLADIGLFRYKILYLELWMESIGIRLFLGDSDKERHEGHEEHQGF